MKALMVYEDENGGRFEGETPTDIVRAMSQSKLSAAKTLAKYRKATARRIKDLRGLTIETGGDNFFLDSLTEHGLVKRID